MLIFNACFEVLTKYQYLVKPDFFKQINSISQKKNCSFRQQQNDAQPSSTPHTII